MFCYELLLDPDLKADRRQLTREQTNFNGTKKQTNEARKAETWRRAWCAGSIFTWETQIRCWWTAYKVHWSGSAAGVTVTSKGCTKLGSATRPGERAEQKQEKHSKHGPWHVSGKYLAQTTTRWLTLQRTLSGPPSNEAHNLWKVLIKPYFTKPLSSACLILEI